MRRKAASAKPADLPGHAAPAVGLDVPLEMLAACHGRIEAQCATVRRLSDATHLRELTQSLAADHRELERRWRGLRRCLEQVAAGHAATLPAEAVETFITLYVQHIAREESELLPMAGRLLSDAQLDRIGQAMRARRGVGLSM